MPKLRFIEWLAILVAVIVLVGPLFTLAFFPEVFSDGPLQ